MRRIVSLWLPRFATDRLTRPGGPLAAWRQAPLATVGTGAGGLRVVAANAAATAQGVAPGLSAADARAVCPGLKTVEASPAADLRALAALAEWCGRWSPLTAAEGLGQDGGGGLWVDSTGCDHLFGGEAAMLEDMIGRLAALGVEARAGLADTPGAAWGAARFATAPDRPAEIVPAGAVRQWLSGLPVAALRLPAETADTLHRLGVRRIGDLLALPRAPLAKRFGRACLRRLDQFLGHESEPITPLRPPPAADARLAFAEPIGRSEDVAAALDRLLAGICRQLERADRGARRLELALYRVDGSHVRRAVGTARPVRNPSHLARLFGEALKDIDAGFGIEAMSLAVTAADAMPAIQPALPRQTDERGGEQLGLLIDRLGNRLGRGRVFRQAARASHLPEQAVRPAAPLDRAPPPSWPPALRPPRLLARPEAVGTEAESNGPPRRFRWRGTMHEIARCDGPERIAVPWWYGPAPTPYDAARDYWRVEDAAGQRFWLFKDDAAGVWYVHGMFS